MILQRRKLGERMKRRAAPGPTRKIAGQKLTSANYGPHRCRLRKEQIISARQHADTFDRHRLHKKSPRVTAATAALLIGISSAAVAQANEHTTTGSTIAADTDELLVANSRQTTPENPAYSQARTAIATMATPAAAPEAHTVHVTLTGCVPGMNC
jgi:hypothetical protein